MLDTICVSSKNNNLKVSVVWLRQLLFYGLDNGLIDSLVKPSYSLFDPNEIYVEVLDQGKLLYSYGTQQIYNESAIVGLIDVNPELQGIVYQSNHTLCMKCVRMKVAMLTCTI